MPKNDPTDTPDGHLPWIDPLKAGETDAYLQFKFHDQTPCGLRIRNGVADFVDEAEGGAAIEPIATLMMDGEAWHRLYVDPSDLSDLFSSGKVAIEGDIEKSKELLSLFDSFKV